MGRIVFYYLFNDLMLFTNESKDRLICIKKNSIESKLNYEIKYTRTLKIDRYCSDQNIPQEYELYAILVHSGYSVNSGHYYSYCKTSTGTWAKFDDCSVINVNPDSVLQKQPYILYYRRISAESHNSQNRSKYSPSASPVQKKI